MSRTITFGIAELKTILVERFNLDVALTELTFHFDGDGAPTGVVLIEQPDWSFINRHDPPARGDDVERALRLFPEAHDVLTRQEFRDAKGNWRSLIDQQNAALKALRALDASPPRDEMGKSHD